MQCLWHFSFLGGSTRGLNSGTGVCQASPLPLKPLHQSFFLGFSFLVCEFICHRESHTNFAWTSFKLWSSCLHPSSSWGNRCVPPRIVRFLFSFYTMGWEKRYPGNIWFWGNGFLFSSCHCQVWTRARPLFMLA
jgi:hypothetical protein